MDKNTELVLQSQKPEHVNKELKPTVPAVYMYWVCFQL